MLIEIFQKLTDTKPSVLPLMLLTVFNFVKDYEKEDLDIYDQVPGDNFPYPLFKR